MDKEKKSIFALTPEEEERKRRVLEEEAKMLTVPSQKDSPRLPPLQPIEVKEDISSEVDAKTYALALCKNPKALDNPFNVLRQIMIGYKGVKPTDQKDAAKTFLEYAFGKPKENIEINNINPLTNKSDMELLEYLIGVIGIDMVELVIRKMKGETLEAEVKVG